MPAQTTLADAPIRVPFPRSRRGEQFALQWVVTHAYQNTHQHTNTAQLTAYEEHTFDILSIHLIS